MPNYKTGFVWRKLGVPLSRLRSLFATGRLAPLEKDSSGDYIWSEADIEAARKALAVDRRRRGQRVQPAGVEAVTS